MKAEQFDISYNWTLTANGIFFEDRQPDHTQINHFDFGTKQTRPVLKLPQQTLSHANTMTYLPRQQTLIFNQLQYPQVDVMRLRHPLLQ